MSDVHAPARFRVGAKGIIKGSAAGVCRKGTGDSNGHPSDVALPLRITECKINDDGSQGARGRHGTNRCFTASRGFRAHHAQEVI